MNESSAKPGERIYIPHQVLPGETKEQAARRMAEEMVARLKAQKEKSDNDDSTVDVYEPRYSPPSDDEQKHLLRHLKEIQDYQERNGLTEKGPALGG